MKRTNGWKSNPQAMAAVSTRPVFGGSSSLGSQVDADTWITPRWILAELGGFDLDPCAANSLPYWCAPKSFLKLDNGLEAEWEGRVFMNPPFSNTAPWLEKHAAHANGISLVPASVESQIWRKVVWPNARAILLLHGRTRFCNPDGSATTGRPLRSIALIAWAKEDREILEACQLAGVFLKDWNQR